MAEREKYYIGLNGQTFEVSKELDDARRGLLQRAA